MNGRKKIDPIDHVEERGNGIDEFSISLDDIRAKNQPVGVGRRRIALKKQGRRGGKSQYEKTPEFSGESQKRLTGSLKDTETSRLRVEKEGLSGCKKRTNSLEFQEEAEEGKEE